MQDANRKRRGIDYAAIRLTDADIADGSYKLRIGSGAAWDARGAFQLVLLRSVGLMPHHTLLDYGCGPGRGAVHLIGYLEPGHYAGVDINPDYIRVARQVIDERRLSGRKPVFGVASEYENDRRFDFCLLFSVLNHCAPEEIRAIFEFLRARLSPGGVICITHARGVSPGYYEPHFECTRTFTAADFDITEFGWTPAATLFPVIELRARGD
jgi:SAM-dependent methyltransferase